MEMFDGGGGSGGAIGVASHGQAGREADERAVALARVLAVMIGDRTGSDPYPHGPHGEYNC